VNNISLGNETEKKMSTTIDVTKKIAACEVDLLDLKKRVDDSSTSEADRAHLVRRIVSTTNLLGHWIDAWARLSLDKRATTAAAATGATGPLQNQLDEEEEEEEDEEEDEGEDEGVCRVDKIQESVVPSAQPATAAAVTRTHLHELVVPRAARSVAPVRRAFHATGTTGMHDTERRLFNKQLRELMSDKGVVTMPCQCCGKETVLGPGKHAAAHVWCDGVDDENLYLVFACQRCNTRRCSRCCDCVWDLRDVGLTGLSPMWIAHIPPGLSRNRDKISATPAAATTAVAITVATAATSNPGRVSGPPAIAVVTAAIAVVTPPATTSGAGSGTQQGGPNNQGPSNNPSVLQKTSAL
jgi:hypothetical protein